ncbi:MAG: hypothetical protein WAW41_05405 [Methylobacter sp.]
MQIPSWMDFTVKLFGAFGIFFIAWQVLLSKQQLQADHERSRRQMASDVIRYLSNSISSGMVAGRWFAEGLGKNQTAALFYRKPFRVPIKTRDFLEVCLGDAISDDQVEEDNILLTIRQIQHLRWLVTAYLNNLEAALVPWYYEVADRRILQNELWPLLWTRRDKDTKNDIFILEKFREIQRVPPMYPAIEAFITQIKNDPPRGFDRAVSRLPALWRDE